MVALFPDRGTAATYTNIFTVVLLLQAVSTEACSDTACTSATAASPIENQCIHDPGGAEGTCFALPTGYLNCEAFGSPVVTRCGAPTITTSATTTTTFTTSLSTTTTLTTSATTTTSVSTTTSPSTTTTSTIPEEQRTSTIVYPGSLVNMSKSDLGQIRSAIVIYVSEIPGSTSSDIEDIIFSAGSVVASVILRTVELAEKLSFIVRQTNLAVTVGSNTIIGVSPDCSSPCIEGVSTKTNEDDRCVVLLASVGPVCVATVGGSCSPTMAYCPGITTVPITTTTTTPTAPDEECTGCLGNTAGFCKHLASNFCLPYQNPTAQKCFQGMAQCRSILPVPKFNCLGCNFGTAGNCLHKPSGYCLGYIPGRPGECIETTDVCPPIDRGPEPKYKFHLRFAGKGYNEKIFKSARRFATAHDSDMPDNQAFFVYYDTTAEVINSMPVCSVGGEPGEACLRDSECCGGYCGAGQVCFADNFFPIHKYTSTSVTGLTNDSIRDRVLTDCQHECLADAECNGVYMWLRGTSAYRCVGLYDVGGGESKPTSLWSQSYERKITPDTMSSTATTTVSSTLTTSDTTTTTPTTSRITTSTLTTSVSSTTTDTTSVSSTTTQTTSAHAVQGLELVFSSSNTTKIENGVPVVVPGLRFPKAFDWAHQNDGRFGDMRLFEGSGWKTAAEAKNACESECLSTSGCKGIFVFRYGGLAGENGGADFRCRVLSDVGLENGKQGKKLTVIESQSYAVRTMCKGCEHYSGACKHKATGFCMSVVSGTDACVDTEEWIYCASKYL